MMRKRSWLFYSSILILMLMGYTNPACSDQAEASPGLPNSIREMLNQEYPGWTLAPVNAQIRQEFHTRHARPLPSLTTGDFNLDGRKDYAVQIVLKTLGQEEQFIIVFLNSNGTFEETILESMGIDPSYYLWVVKKAIDETGTHPDKPVSKDILMVLGGPIGETDYSYDEGRFHEISLPDNSDHPDTSIPRILSAPDGPLP